MTTGEDGTFTIASERKGYLDDAFLATSDAGADVRGLSGSMTHSRSRASPQQIVLKPALMVTVLVVDARGGPIKGAGVVGYDDSFPAPGGM